VLDVDNIGAYLIKEPSKASFHKTVLKRAYEQMERVCLPTPQIVTNMPNLQPIISFIPFGKLLLTKSLLSAKNVDFMSLAELLGKLIGINLGAAQMAGKEFMHN